MGLVIVRGEHGAVVMYAWRRLRLLALILEPAGLDESRTAKCLMQGQPYAGPRMIRLHLHLHLHCTNARVAGQP